MEKSSSSSFTSHDGEDFDAKSWKSVAKEEEYSAKQQRWMSSSCSQWVLGDFRRQVAEIELVLALALGHQLTSLVERVEISWLPGKDCIVLFYYCEH